MSKISYRGSQSKADTERRQRIHINLELDRRLVVDHPQLEISAYVCQNRTDSRSYQKDTGRIVEAGRRKRLKIFVNSSEKRQSSLDRRQRHKIFSQQHYRKPEKEKCSPPKNDFKSKADCVSTVQYHSKEMQFFSRSQIMTPHELKRALLNLRVRRNNEMATYNRKSISYGDYQGVNLALGCSVPKHNNWYLTAPAGPWKFANATPVL